MANRPYGLVEHGGQVRRQTEFEDLPYHENAGCPLQHGSAGSNARDEYWAKTFNEMGIASFLVDSFSGRGLSRTTMKLSQLTPYNLMLDGYRR